MWVALPGLIAIAGIYFFFLSKGSTPASASNGIKLTLQSGTFPLASPLLSGFSADDLLHGLIYHTGKPVLEQAWSMAALIVLALASVWLVFVIIVRIPGRDYRLFVIVFYSIAIIFFTIVYLRQLTVSYEARHFRLIGILIVPGVVHLAGKAKVPYRVLLGMILLGIAYTSARYLVKGMDVNKTLAARGTTGIAQPNIDQASLNQVMKLDRENRNAVFIFVSDDIGLEIMHNRIITLQPIGDDLKINTDDYRYEGHGGPLYIILPENYAGPKEKMIMKSFPGYKGWNESMLSAKYVLYSAK